MSTTANLSTSAPRKMKAEHVVVCRLPGEKLGFFGWPTVARMDDGTLVAASSGLRSQHVCPWGKTVLNTSTDDGKTWSAPRVINDSPIDDRDAGVINLGGGKLLVSWFTADTRVFINDDWCKNWVESWRETLETWTDDLVKPWIGSWTILSEDGGQTWGQPMRAPVSAPHGPIRLRSGALLYFGKRYMTGWDEMKTGNIVAAFSPDNGQTWTERGSVPLYPKTQGANYHEPHVVELPSGKLVGLIRVQDAGDSSSLADAGVIPFSIMQTESVDEGHTWSSPRALNFHGSPPHLLRHSSGALLLTYGYRSTPYGQRVAISRDEAQTWEHDWIIRDDGPDGDLGYPSTVELGDGSLFTLCYQRVPGDEKCSLLGSRWQLPG